MAMNLQVLKPVKGAGTIEEVIVRLKMLIEECKTSNSRIGFFACLYLKVTERVRDAIQRGEFDDDTRMKRFDVIFANRYLDAVSLWRAGEQPTGPWQLALNSSRKMTVLVLQHLLLGMSAHINFDLGIAAVQTVGDADVDTIRKDFNRINDIIGSLTFEVMQSIQRVSPLLSLFGFHATNESLLIQFSITNARDGAWAFAEDLAEKTGADKDACMAARENTIKQLGAKLITSSGLIRITMFFVWLLEWKSPRKIISVLSKAKKNYISINTPQRVSSKALQI